MRGLRLLVTCSILLPVLALTGCGDGSSTCPCTPDQVEWHVPADLPTIAAAAAAAGQGDAIVVAPGTYLEHGIVLDVGVDLRGASGKAADVVIDGQGLGRVLAVQLGDSTVAQPGDTTSVIANLVITGGSGDEDGGGGLLAELHTELRNVRFLKNNATGPGGGLRSDRAHLKLVACGFDSNHTANVGSHGGGLAATADGRRLVEMDSCSFTGNTATGSGGGAFVGLSDLRLAHTSFDGNHSQTWGYHGGGLAYEGNTGLDAVVDTCVFTGNSSTDIGGGANCFGVGSFTGCLFEGNWARQGGAMLPGAIYAVTECRFIDNTAVSGGAGDPNGGLGGALFQPRGEGVIRCEFRGNSAVGGSAIFGSTDTSIEDCLFTGNTADGSGTVFWTHSTAVRFDRCEFSANTAGGGGAFRIEGGADAVFADCLFDENTASVGGVGQLSTSTVALDSCTVTDNTVIGYGGAFMLEGYGGGGRAVLVLDDCLVTGNNADDNGGAFFMGFEADLTATDSDLRGNTSPTNSTGFVGGNCAATFTCCDVVPGEIEAIGTVTVESEGCD